MRTSRLLFKLDLLAGTLGLALVGIGLVGVGGAQAAAPASDGSDWGPQGLLTSDSAVTATWDNNGNVASSDVPRDNSQVIAHTGGQTYAAIPQADQTSYASYFGSGNGYGGLKVSVSQTQDLVNQAVTVSISGAKANIPAGQTDSTSYFQIFQCWGARGSDGQPDPTASTPDPATCQVGALGQDSSPGGYPSHEYRMVYSDPLLANGGDWAQYDTISNGIRPETPFEAIDGGTGDSNLESLNTYFNHTTTNEFSHVVVPASGATTRQFEMQTSEQSNGLGCGVRAEQASTATCWLVVVPRIQGTDDQLGPISPAVWGQRLQFKLGFQPIESACPSGQSRALIAGSEMLANAAASWIPGICDAANVGLGYSRIGDEVARTQFAGTSPAILTSRPVPATTPSIAVPLALTAPVIAFNIDYQPTCSDGSDPTAVTTDSGAVACGYASLAALNADQALSGKPIRDLRLNATLVAKLLTQSYQTSILGCSSGCGYAAFIHLLPAWVNNLPLSLTTDPEFRALNPQLHLGPGASTSFTDVSTAILESVRSDAANQVWTWILNDPEAASFLSGCMDAKSNNSVINPFYSSRQYTTCSSQATSLEATAQADRDAVKNLASPNPTRPASTVEMPSGYLDQALSYPPEGAPYPLPSWEQQKAYGTQTARTLQDLLPSVDYMATGARDTFIGYKPSNSDFCLTANDATCLPAPGKWKDPKLPQLFGVRHVMTVTDASSAARYQLSTAQLCSDAGACVGANTTTLQKAASQFVASDVPGYLTPPTTPDYAGGAYPLTMPVYAAVKKSLSATALTTYASAFAYITSTGQVPGYAQGSLPPGFAPLPSSLTTAAASGLSSLRAAAAAAAAPTTRATTSVRASTVKPTTKASTKPSSTASSTASSSASSTASSSSSGSAGGGSGAAVASDAPSAGPAPASSAASPSASASSATTTVQTMPVAASTESWHGWLLPVGLGLAIGAGLAGPFLRRRSNVTLR